MYLCFVKAGCMTIYKGKHVDALIFEHTVELEWLELLW